MCKEIIYSKVSLKLNGRSSGMQVNAFLRMEILTLLTVSQKKTVLQETNLYSLWFQRES